MKIRGRYLTQRSYVKALAEYEAEQKLRSPTFEGTWAKDIIGKKVIEAEHIFVGGEPIGGTAGWHGRVVKQGARASRIEDLWFERPLVKVFYKDGHFSVKVDTAKLHELEATAKLYVEDPKLVFEKVRNKITDKYAERRYLRDSALFV